MHRGQIDMFEKVDIYPYQRVREEHRRTSSRSKTNNSFKFTLGDSLKKVNLLGQAQEFSPRTLLISLKQVISLEIFLISMSSLILARAFIFGDLLPFIFAFLFAFAYLNKTQALFIAFFASIGFMTVLEGFNLWSNIICIFALVAILRYVKILEINKWWGIPLLSTSSVLLIKSLLLLSSEFIFYQFMLIIFEVMMVGALTFVFLLTADVISKNKAIKDYRFEDMAAFIALGIGLLMGLHDLHFLDLNIAAIISRLAILIAAFLWGSSGGTMLGVMAGVIPAISSTILAQSLGLYAFSGLMAGFFNNFGRLGVVIGFLLGHLALAVFVLDTHSTSVLLWETGIASLIFLLLPSSIKRNISVPNNFNIQSLSKWKGKDLEIWDHQIKAEALKRVQGLADVIEELSATLTEKKDTPTESSRGNEFAYLNYLYEELSQGFCNNCSKYDYCWGKDSYATSQEILDIFTYAENQGQVYYEDCSDEFKRKCLYTTEFIQTVNNLFDKLRMNEYWMEKINESRGLVANQLKGISQVIKNLAAEIEMKIGVDLDLRKKILMGSKRLGIKLRDISPLKTSGNEIHYVGVADSCANGSECETIIAPGISLLLGEILEVSEKKCPRLMGKGNCEFTLGKTFTYKVLSGAAQVAKDKVCGDSFTIATLKEGKELLVLSDGMGIGEEAARESRSVVNLLENLLNSGFNEEIALKTINSVLLLRSTHECFATIDMLIIDLYNCGVNFIKIGSVPSFIKRNAQVNIISSSSLPIGIMEDVDISSEKSTLFPNDMLVMVSDGVLEASRDLGGEIWIKELLLEIDEEDPQALAELIMARALAMSHGKVLDDMTAICLLISKND